MNSRYKAFREWSRDEGGNSDSPQRRDGEKTGRHNHTRSVFIARHRILECKMVWKSADRAKVAQTAGCDGVSDRRVNYGSAHRSSACADRVSFGRAVTTERHLSARAAFGHPSTEVDGKGARLGTRNAG
jgi:hypothetical protein